MKTSDNLKRPYRTENVDFNNNRTILRIANVWNKLLWRYVPDHYNLKLYMQKVKQYLSYISL